VFCHDPIVEEWIEASDYPDNEDHGYLLGWYAYLTGIPFNVTPSTEYKPFAMGYLDAKDHFKDE
jgi:hypothetical protein